MAPKDNHKGDLLGATRQLGSSLAKAAGRVGRGICGAGDAALTGTSRVVSWGRDAFDRCIDEDEIAVLEQCPIALGILQRRQQFESDPEVFGRLYNVRLRPVVTAAVMGATGVGLMRFEQTLAGVTRHIFDSEGLVGGWAGQHIARLLGAERAAVLTERIK